MKNQLFNGDSEEVLKGIPEGSFDACVTDPPYGLGTKEPTGPEIDAYLAGEAGIDTGGDFMGKDWDIPKVALWREVYRTMKDGGVVMAFAGTRTLDLMAAGIGAAGFQYVGTLAWVHCLTADAEILTDHGWEAICGPLVGRRTVGMDVRTGELSWQDIQGHPVGPYRGDVYRLKGGGTNQLVTPEHRCVVRGEAGYSVVRAHELTGEVVVPIFPSDVYGMGLTEMKLEEEAVTVSCESYAGLVGCVQTPTGTFVARQNGKVFVTGNSQGFPKSLNITKKVEGMLEGKLREQGVEGVIRWK